jgi:hypothetical protein
MFRHETMCPRLVSVRVAVVGTTYEENLIQRPWIVKSNQLSRREYFWVPLYADRHARHSRLWNLH